MLTVGRIVHYIAYNKTRLAAIVTQVEDDGETCDLAVFTSLRNVAGTKTGGVQFHFDVRPGELGEDGALQPGTWVWPQRV